MRLEDIIRNAGAVEVRGNRCLDITDICNDSREVTPGAVFIAVKGHEIDGALSPNTRTPDLHS